MKTLVEQVNELTYDLEKEEHYEMLKEALTDYKMMIKEGLLVPRGNRLETINYVMTNEIKTNRW